MIDEKARDEKAFEAARKAWLESASDYTRLDESIRAAIAAYLEAAKPKEAGGLKLGSRLTVEGVEAVVVSADLIERSQHQLAASPFPFDRCVGAEISAMLSAAGDRR